MPRLLLAALSAIVVACSSQSPLPTDPATGLPILDELPRFIGSAGALQWHESSDRPEGFGPDDTAHATLGDLVTTFQGFLAEQGAEMTSGFLGPPTADEAMLVIHASGMDDDATAGMELVAQVRRNERGWYVDVVRFRQHCRRGTDEESESCA